MKHTPEPPKTRRCAIYTRKSTDEGLDVEFSTLDNQRLAAESYITSQKGEGWICLPDRYDDGGFSGGTMDRPALQRLLADVASGKVDCIVVYKVDRLSRSLLDFARIIDILNEANCSFVAVTQHFSTADSLGRLTLNILLSFAQFERELIAERTRDKISAARKQGRWTGGTPVLGYDIDPAGGKLRINPGEAGLVRDIYNLYLEEKALIPVVRLLRDRGVTNKTWVTRDGTLHKGKPFGKTSLHALLSNIIYTGKVRHHGQVYDGKHEPIVDTHVWNTVQSILKANRPNGKNPRRTATHGLLKGLLHCQTCNALMVHSSTRKKGKAKAYRYYVCTHAQKHGWETCPDPSIPAQEMENYVVEEIKRIGQDAKLIEKMFDAVNDEVSREMESLKTDEARMQQTHKELVLRLRKKIGKANPQQLVDLQEEASRLENDMRLCRERMKTLQHNTITKDDVTRAMAQFHPVWKALTHTEQANILHMLIEHIAYDTHRSTVSITFHDTALRDYLAYTRTGEQHDTNQTND